LNLVHACVPASFTFYSLENVLNLFDCGTVLRNNFVLLQDCPDDSVAFRSEQCSKFNNVSFGGRTYNWEPYIGRKSNIFMGECLVFMKKA